MAIGHLAKSRQIIYDELSGHPGEPYRRSGPKMRELASAHDLSVLTLDQSLVELASLGLISKKRAGRVVDYLWMADGERGGGTRGLASRGEPKETRTYTVTYEQDEDDFIIASVPTLPGCHSQGRTIDEARSNVREAIRGYVASLAYRGETVPTESASEQVEITI